MLEPRVGDNTVFGAGTLGRISESQRLIRHHAQFGDDRMRVQRHADGTLRHLIGRGILVRPRANEQQCRLRGRVRRLNDGEPVFPYGFVDLFFGTPVLRCELEDVALGAIAGVDRAEQLPRVGIVFRMDVVFERLGECQRGQEEEGETHPHCHTMIRESEAGTASVCAEDAETIWMKKANSQPAIAQDPLSRDRAQSASPQTYSSRVA